MTGSGDRRRRIELLAVWLGAGLSLFAETRVWTDATGTLFEGTYYKELLGGVLVKDQNGANRRIRMEQLSKADLNYIERHVPPEVEAKVSYKTRKLPRTEWSRDDDYTTIYTFGVRVEKISKLPHKGRLSAELFVVGNERSVKSSTHCVLMQHSQTRFVFPDQKDAVFEYTGPDVPFHIYRASWVNLAGVVNRGKTYLGYIIAVFDSSGAVIFLDTDIQGRRWLTDDLPRSVEKLRELAVNNKGSAQSRHFNDSFKQIDPPRIPWFQRTDRD